ncbi:hypothetical protein SLEP1_g44988 [Rubroshorea leprosula]|uniref:Uncharacterized protein n=1 Tax=Rubroshorea leprosula TaxID=152421 RepID=A0AAV5LHT4_9ROSI|nr:hypothetical protein SLEP1_g44988 [Rubroshorea leprosula]
MAGARILIVEKSISSNKLHLGFIFLNNGGATGQAVSLLATAVEILVTGETMQMMATTDQHYSMEYHMDKSYNKTASFISNSCKAMALLSGQTAGVAELAFDYGKNVRGNMLSNAKSVSKYYNEGKINRKMDALPMQSRGAYCGLILCGLAYRLIDDILDFTGTSASLGKGSLSDIRFVIHLSLLGYLSFPMIACWKHVYGIITSPMLFALEEFPQLRAIIDQGFENPSNVDTLSNNFIDHMHPHPRPHHLVLSVDNRGTGIPLEESWNRKNRKLAKNHSDLAAQQLIPFLKATVRM